MIKKSINEIFDFNDLLTVGTNHVSKWITFNMGDDYEKHVKSLSRDIKHELKMAEIVELTDFHKNKNKRMIAVRLTL